MKKFPVKIDLSTFFEDERKFVIILVDPQWKSVEYLQHRVEEIFDVRPVHFLTSDNLFIPPQESIEVVEFTESLKAFIPKHALEESRRRSKQFLKPENNQNKGFTSITNELPVEENSVKKRKYYTLGTEILGSSTPNQTKKSKRTLDAVPNSPAPVSNESQEITSTNEQFSLFKEDTKAQSNRSHDNLNISNGKISDSEIVEKQSSTGNEGEEQRSISKRKRKRSRKQTSEERKNSELEVAEKSVNSIKTRSVIPSSTFLSISRPMVTTSHIYFDDSTIVESTTNKQPVNHIITSNIGENNKSPKVIFKCNLYDDNIGKPLGFPLQVINRSSKARKPIIDIQENILLPPANIDILTKTGPSKELSTELEKSILANTFNATESSDNIETESGTENGNNVLKEDNLESTKDDILNDSTDFDNKKPQNDLNITNVLEKTNGLESTTKEIENDSQIGNLEKTTHPDNENGINAEEEEIPTENAMKQKEAQDTDHSMTELSGDKNNPPREETNKETKQLQEEPSIKTTTNTSDVSNSSLALDESCVIDLDDDDEDVIDLSDADDQQQSLRMSRSTKLSETLNKSIRGMSITELLPFCTPLIGMPALGDIVVFKFNRRALGEKMDRSQFIACKCEHINRRTKVLKLAIIDASLENDIIPHHYIYQLDESLDNRFMNIKLPEMFDAKVLVNN